MTQHDVQFTHDKQDRALIQRIGDRALELGLVDASAGYSMMDCLMDINAAHSNGCPLDLARLLAADDFNFIHDVAGIARHLDRNSGKLTGHFLPRFASKS